MLLLPNASCCKSITCGKLQKKPLEALGNSTDFMLLALADRHLPQPAGCGNYNLLPLPYLFLYLYRLYQYHYHYHDCTTTYHHHHHNQQQQGANDILQHFRLLRQLPNSPNSFWFSRIPGASTLILQRQEAYLEPWWPALFRIGRKFLNGQKILKKQQSWKKIVGGIHPRKMPPSFSVTNPSDFRSGTFSHPFTYFWTGKSLSFKQIRKSQPREIRLKNGFKTLPHFFSNPPIPRKSIPPTRQPCPWHSLFHVACAICYALRKDTLQKKNARKKKRSKIDVYHPGKDFSHGTKTSFVVFKTWRCQNFMVLPKLWIYIASN